MKYKTTIITASVHPESGNPIYSENATHISIGDEGGGMFVVIAQDGEHIRLDPDEIETVFQVAQRLLADAGV